ncbi:MAG TPA: sugar ABC transporter permease [Vicinamibacterales bacterium]|nr:sugar ABC transporter permease [Vicinamibacterales bacterium]
MRATSHAREARAAWLFVLPAIGLIALVTLVPVLWTFWESLHLHDLRMPWLGRPFVGLDNYREALTDARLRGALVHSAGFTVSTVLIEVVLGLGLALAMDRAWRGRALLRAVVLLPWAIPTVVAALVWRFLFDARSGAIASLLGTTGIFADVAWLSHPWLAWVPIVMADVWRMTPFVALLLLAGLQQIDRTLYEAAQLDGAGSWQQFREITLPLLGPALAVTVLFRALDAFRVFDLVYVLTRGGPGTATEPASLYTFVALLQHLRFGYGSALASLVFALTFALSLAYIRLARASLIGEVR